MLLAASVISRFRRFPGLPLLLLLLPHLAACQKTADQPVTPVETITLAYPNSFYSVLFSVAHTLDYFKAEGLEVTPQFHDFGKVAVDAMLDGKADLAVSGDTVAMFAISGGRQVSILAELMTSRRNEAIVARKDRGIGTPRDLEGRAIGVALGTTGHFFLESFLAVNGISRDAVRIVNLKPGEMMAALDQGTVDAVAIWQPVLKRLERSLGDNGLLFYDERIYSDIVCLTAAQEFVQQRPETIRKVLRALVRASTFVKEHPAETRRMAAEFLNFDQTVLDEVWETLHFEVTLDQSLLVSLEDQTRWAQQSGFIPRGDIPRYLESMYFDGLGTVLPGAVRIIR